LPYRFAQLQLAHNTWKYDGNPFFFSQLIDIAGVAVSPPVLSAVVIHMINLQEC
jgi:hypothetical protein